VWQSFACKFVFSSPISLFLSWAKLFHPKCRSVPQLGTLPSFAMALGKRSFGTAVSREWGRPSGKAAGASVSPPRLAPGRGWQKLVMDDRRAVDEQDLERD
jgi:hypothetical protein